MKKYIAIGVIALSTISCNKTTTTTPSTPTNNSGGCGDGMICFKRDGTSISKAGGGYELADTNLFVKYEDNNVQLSIDVFGKTTGNYNVTDIRKQGNGRIYYFPDANNATGPMYMSETGTLNITSYDATAKKLSGTFSATLYKYDNDNHTFTKTDSVVISEGTFTTISVQKI
ncbi:MAG: hypothetical protein H6550_10685 [Chitinophagales bacterium]|nr:hypothetical protein [Chitinophagales bacterium]